MSEIEFLEIIDCKFPYHSMNDWQALTNLGISISPNAAFAVLEEICRPPASQAVTYETKRLMIDYWSLKFEHPLKEIVLNAAEYMIRGLRMPEEVSMKSMEIAAQFPDQYAVLSILHFAAFTQQQIDSGDRVKLKLCFALARELK